MSKRRHILFGPPGTGKTTTLIRRVEEALRRGVAPERIGFVSFSRRAIHEARERVKQIAAGEFHHFRTIHSTAYHLLDLTRNDVLQSEHLKEFGERVGLPFTTKDMEPSTLLWEGTPGDRCLALHALAKARGTSLFHEYVEAQSQLKELPWPLVQRTVDLYERFKKSYGLWDFPDMIEYAEGELDLDVLFIDEAQDTSASQWKLLRKIARHVPTIFLAGDDDQAVYAWGGADPDQLLRFKGEREVLPQSYRLPRRVKAMADRIAARIHRRVPKQFAPRDAEGLVDWVNEPDHIDLHQPGRFLLLARSNYQLSRLRRMARQQGVVYTLPNGEWSWTLPAVRAAVAYERLRRGEKATRQDVKRIMTYSERTPLPVGKDELTWEMIWPGRDRGRNWMEALREMPVSDREYVRALRRTGESLTKEGRVRIGTVHSVKGAEAEHVVLLTDVSERVARGAVLDPDAEARVQYVAVTRAKESLTLVQPSTITFWNF